MFIAVYCTHWEDSILGYLYAFFFYLFYLPIPHPYSVQFKKLLTYPFIQLNFFLQFLHLTFSCWPSWINIPFLGDDVVDSCLSWIISFFPYLLLCPSFAWSCTIIKETRLCKIIIYTFLSLKCVFPLIWKALSISIDFFFSRKYALISCLCIFKYLFENLKVV